MFRLEAKNCTGWVPRLGKGRLADLLSQPQVPYADGKDSSLASIDRGRNACFSVELQTLHDEQLLWVEAALGLAA